MNPKEAIKFIAEVRAYVKKMRSISAIGSNHNQRTAGYLEKLDQLSKFARNVQMDRFIDLIRKV